MKRIYDITFLIISFSIKENLSQSFRKRIKKENNTKKINKRKKDWKHNNSRFIFASKKKILI